jgi:CheY-like chemotaxis protein
VPPQEILVEADLTRVAQVFINLLNNAAKYTDRGGHIWLTVEQHNTEVLISVRDNGIGIAPEHSKDLFKMFMQLGHPETRSQGGLGIGLSLVRQIVELHSGTIEARSPGLGQGSEFIVRLPTHTATLNTPETPHPTGDGKQNVETPTLRILIVDDNKDGADSLQMMLRLMGNEARTAYDGMEGIKVAEEFRPDVMLLDIGLPTVNGYDVCRCIRDKAWGKDVVLIAVTGWGLEDDRRRSHDAGFDHHMVKPVDAKALTTLLATVRAKSGVSS